MATTQSAISRRTSHLHLRLNDTKCIIDAQHGTGVYSVGPRPIGRNTSGGKGMAAWVGAATRLHNSDVANRRRQ